MNVLRHRPSVHFTPIAPGGFRILSALDQVAESCRVDLMITCGSDSHPPTDPHTRGEAYDVSVHTLTTTQILTVKRWLERILGSAFTVLFEVPSAPSDPELAAIAYVNPQASGPHCHIQVKRGTSFPPEA